MDDNIQQDKRGEMMSQEDKGLDGDMEDEDEFMEELSHGKIKATSTGLALVWDPNPVEKGGGA